jgi:hypothetical protein
MQGYGHLYNALFLISTQGWLYTQTKSHDHENMRTLENHPKDVLWEIGCQF